jgi:hypothetical protein
MRGDRRLGDEVCDGIVWEPRRSCNVIACSDTVSSPVSHIPSATQHDPSSARTLAEEAKRALIERIAGSNVFRKAPRLRQLLLYVGERSLDEGAEPAKEHEIGQQVFGRPVHYDPGEDNIVRNAARQLRLKIREYFDSEGQAEPWVVEIPKGGYRAVFVERVAAPRQEIDADARAPLASSRTPWWWAAVLAVLLTVSLAINLALWLGAGRPSQQGSTRHLVGALFGQLEQPTRIVIGDFGLFLLGSLRGSQYSLEEYMDRRYLDFEPPPGSPPEIHNFGQMLTTRQMASLGEVNAAFWLYRSLSTESRHPPEVRHARSLVSRDMKRDNLILAGTMSSNPWFRLFDDQLTFRWKGNAFTHQGSGEKFEVSNSAASSGRSYARIAVLPSLSGTGRILLITGINMSAVEAGAEFSSSPEGLQELQRRLAVNIEKDKPYFEAIVESVSADFTPNRHRLAAVVSRNR